MHEQHGLPEIVGSMVSGVVLIGGLVCLDGIVWAWAVGLDIVYGAVIGGAIGVTLGLISGIVTGGGATRDHRRSNAYGCGAMAGGPLIAILVIGTVVGLIRMFLQ